MAEHRNLNEKLFELVVKKAVIDKTDAECEAIYEKYKDSAEPHYSESHQQRMEKLIRSSIKKEKRYGHWVRNVVAVFIAVVAIYCLFTSLADDKMPSLFKHVVYTKL